MAGGIFNVERILEICEKILYFLAVNTLFLLSNLPVLLFFLFQGIGNVGIYLPFFLLCLLPAGPAISAVLFSMNRILHGKETSAWKDFKKGYLDSFGKKILLAGIQLSAILVFWTNMEFFRMQLPVFPLVILFFLLFVGAVVITPNLYLLASRYEMKITNYLKGAVILMATKPLLTLGNVAAAFFILMLLEIRAGTVVLFMASIYGYLVVFMNRKVMQILDAQVKEES